MYYSIKSVSNLYWSNAENCNIKTSTKTAYDHIWSLIWTPTDVICIYEKLWLLHWSIRCLQFIAITKHWIFQLLCCCCCIHNICWGSCGQYLMATITELGYFWIYCPIIVLVPVFCNAECCNKKKKKSIRSQWLMVNKELSYIFKKSYHTAWVKYNYRAATSISNL